MRTLLRIQIQVCEILSNFLVACAHFFLGQIAMKGIGKTHKFVIQCQPDVVWDMIGVLKGMVQSDISEEFNISGNKKTMVMVEKAPDENER